ncbi:MAG: hypothetical protein WCY93_07400 [Anaerolineaceae bacterium]
MTTKKASSVPDTSKTYDDCMDIYDENKENQEEFRAGTLADFLGIPHTPQTVEDAKRELALVKPGVVNNWEDHWKGMPDYVNEDKTPIKKMLVTFYTEEAIQEFAELVGQKITKKTRSMSYPAQEKDANSLRRWIDESEDV